MSVALLLLILSRFSVMRMIWKCFCRLLTSGLFCCLFLICMAEHLMRKSILARQFWCRCLVSLTLLGLLWRILLASSGMMLTLVVQYVTWVIPCIILKVNFKTIWMVFW
ncbi:hypothetical protein HMPREF1544_06384 [Mucor circinelloides 1006PhL]|uniref:Uncharacterized protein n=1 Tax=Mucor circinelloides f. circinelloides (strain 1006PhL) TaxID=1220926 RepID=S2JAZ9_MUCC1|nr:hypothetical protein HMPREF1544_06384 [Mucor circinelloides 1006PhL]